MVDGLWWQSCIPGTVLIQMPMKTGFADADFKNIKKEIGSIRVNLYYG